MVKKGPDIFIIGAGIIGLMTAKVLVDAGHTVNCIGESYPGLDKEFASPNAAGTFLPTQNEETLFQQQLIRRTFTHFRKLLKDSSLKWISAVPCIQYYINKPEIWWSDLYQKVEIRKRNLPLGKFNYEVHVSDCIVFDPQELLAFLFQYLKDTSFFSFECKKVEDIRELIGPDRLVVNCSGMGSKYMKGIEDELLYSIKGQIILLDKQIDMILQARDISLYIIPRPRKGTIIGSINQKYAFDNKFDEGTTEELIDRTEQLTKKNSFKDSVVLEQYSALRPYREGGIRLEKEYFSERNGYVIHGYGVGSQGYIMSWGLADEIRKMVEHFKDKNWFLQKFEELWQFVKNRIAHSPN